MNLHRSSKKADWEMIALSERTAFQKLAASTRGIVSPGNIITVTGLIIVVYGLFILVSGNFWTGLLYVVLGRLLDIADGIVAEATKTKSPLGELFDAVADKIGTFLTIFALMFAGIASWWIVGALILPQLIITLTILYKQQKKIRVHPTRQGKVSMALVWVSIVGLLSARALDGSTPLIGMTYGIIAGSFTLGLYAAWQYATGRNQE